MAAHTWELERDLGLARARNDLPEVSRLEADLRAYQATCPHVENPERPGRCYKCGAPVGPGLSRCTAPGPVPVSKVGT